MAPFEKKCIAEGCTDPDPGYGYQASKQEPMKWACKEHRHLLQRPSAAPAEPKTPSDPDLFSR
jgi:hypothetical protein